MNRNVPMPYLISHHHVAPNLIAIIHCWLKQAELSTVAPQQFTQSGPSDDS